MSNLPAIPDPELTLESLRETTLALKEMAENFAGTRGPVSTTVATASALSAQDAELRQYVTDTIQGVNPVTGVTASSPLASSGGTTPVISLSGTVAVGNGGTGATTLTANNVILGNGTSAVQFVAPGASGNVLTSNGTTWQSTAPAVTWTLVKKTADQSTTTNSFADDTLLQFSVSANKSYAFRGSLIVNLGAGGMRVAVNGPASPTSLRVNSGSGTVQTAYDTSFFTSVSSGIVISFPFAGKLDNAGNAGTLAIRIRQDTASGTTVFEKGCWLEWTEVT